MTERTKSICIDVDGVLAQYDGWKGVDVIGDPYEGAVGFVNYLYEYFKVIIHTTRANPEVNKLFTKEELEQKIALWLDKWGFKYDEIQGKPIAVGYVDDKAIHCNPLRNSKAWNYFASSAGQIRLMNPNAHMLNYVNVQSVAQENQG